MENGLVDEEAKEKLLAIQALIRDYLEEKGYSEEEIEERLSDEAKTGLPVRQKLLLQQMVRERAKKDGRDLDELIIQEKAKEENPSLRGQVLGVLSKIEGAYVEVMLQEHIDKKVMVKH